MDETGDRPIAGARVRLEAADDIERSAATDERGAFTIGGIPAGRYRLVVFLVEAGEFFMDVEVRASAATVVTVTVEDRRSR